MTALPEFFADIGLPTAEEAEQEIKFRTFRNCLTAWRRQLAAEGEFLGIDDDADLLAVTGGPLLARLQATGQVTEPLRDHYRRGNLTLRAMVSLNEALHEGLAATLAMVFPVMAYYTVHGLGEAALLSIGAPEALTHASFRNAMSSSVVGQYFPGALSGRVRWIENIEALQIEGIPLSIAEVNAQSALETPTQHNRLRLSVKSLVTTYREEWEIQASQTRKTHGVRRLAGVRRAEARGHVHPITIIDFLWRLRRRAQYADPAMYLHSLRAGQEALAYCQELTELAARISLVLKAIIRRRLGQVSFDTLGTAP